MSIYENSCSGNKTSGNTQIDRCGCAHNFSDDCVATGSVLDCEKNSNGYRTGYGYLDYKSQSECHDCTSYESRKVKTDQCGCGMPICDGDYTCIDGVSQRHCMDMCGNESFITGGTACKNSAQTHDAYTKTSCGTASECPNRPSASAGAYTPCNKAAGTYNAASTSEANTKAKNAANTCVQNWINSKDCTCECWKMKSNCGSCGSGCTAKSDLPTKGTGTTITLACQNAQTNANALSCGYACNCPSTTGTIVFTLASSECSSADGKLSISKGTSRQDVSIQLQVGQSKTVSGLELGTWSIGTSGYFIGVCGGPSSSGQITMRLDKSSVSLTSGSPTARVTLTAYRYG